MAPHRAASRAGAGLMLAFAAAGCASHAPSPTVTVLAAVAGADRAGRPTLMIGAHGRLTEHGRLLLHPEEADLQACRWRPGRASAWPEAAVRPIEFSMNPSEAAARYMSAFDVLTEARGLQPTASERACLAKLLAEFVSREDRD